MKAIRYLIVAAILASLAGCVTAWPRPTPTTCPKHHVPLQNRIMFGPGLGTNVCPSDEYLDVMTRVGDRFAYCVPFGFDDHRNDIFRVRHRVYYCPVCQQGLESAFSKYQK